MTSAESVALDHAIRSKVTAGGLGVGVFDRGGEGAAEPVKSTVLSPAPKGKLEEWSGRSLNQSKSREGRFEPWGRHQGEP